MADAYIVDGIRTPIGKLGGSLSSVRADDLAALPITELVKRNPDIPTESIDDVIIGCHNQAGEDNRNVARMALLLAGLPVEIPGETINRLCASGMSAVVHAVRAIKAGDGDIFIAGGMEHMTRSPWVISKTSKSFGNDAQMFDSSFGWRFVNPKMQQLYGIDSMGMTAENLADLYKISREEQDEFAYHSQMKATKARNAGRFGEEIMPVSIIGYGKDNINFQNDEFIKPETSLEILSGLKAAFRKDGGSVTAGNASGLNDGAAALYIVSESALKRFNLRPMARIVSSAVIGVEPRVMGIGPVKATQKALSKAGISVNDLGVIEINEAFAAQVIACVRELKLEPDDSRININGGAIALGHPLGMSGTRIIQTAAIELQKHKVKYALATMCVGLGQGYAVVLEKV